MVMVDGEKVHIAVVPPDTLDVSLIGSVAEIIDKSLYDTRLLLAGDIPKIIAHCDSTQAAESMVRYLRASGLAVLPFTDSELRQSPQCFTAHTLEFADAEVVFRDSSGHVKSMREHSVFLIIKGRIHTSVESETTTVKTRLNVTATLLTGGIPIQRKVKEKTTTSSVEAEYFARLYDRQSMDTCVEVLQHRMNYSFLGAGKSVSSVANFNTVITELREMFPRAIFDDRLMKPFNVSVSSSRVREDIDINCKLIYSFYLAMNGPNSTG
jgi:hypothetical protein